MPTLTCTGQLSILQNLDFYNTHLSSDLGKLKFRDTLRRHLRKYAWPMIKQTHFCFFNKVAYSDSCLFGLRRIDRRMQSALHDACNDVLSDSLTEHLRSKSTSSSVWPIASTTSAASQSFINAPEPIIQIPQRSLNCLYASVR